jgi:hypothetical protein
MELTRRDALVALAGGTSITGVSGGLNEILNERRPPGGHLDDDRIEQLIAITAPIYPSSITVSRGFIETFIIGRTEGREEYRKGIVEALDTVEQASQQQYTRALTSLSESKVEMLLRNVGADTAYPVPDGTVPERIRYYLINELLYALYATPVGGQLVGYENPDGYPGGTLAYQRGPEE